MDDVWTTGLNPEQQEAVLHDTGPLLILAGAGSGKTTVLVSRTGRLIAESVATAEQICVLTFTNKAASELKHRVNAKLGQRAQSIWAGTFHAFGLQVLRQFHKQAHLPKHFGILGASDSQALVKELLKDLNLAGKVDFDASKLLSLLADWREKGKTSGSGENVYEIAAEWLLPKYIKRLHHLGVVDFEDLIMRPLQLFHDDEKIRQRVQNAFLQVMVDEFQDTNRAQMSLVSVLSEQHRNLAVVGDDDQSIYGWRGARIENILGFPQAFQPCKVIRLERNYRSTPSILNLANAVIAKNEDRHGKTLRSCPQAVRGELPELFIYENDDEEVERVVDDIEHFIKAGQAYSDVAVLFRSNSQGAFFEAELKRRGLPHKVTGGTGFFERKEIRDVLAYLRCALKPNEIAFRRILNTPSRGIGDTTLEALSQRSLQAALPLHRVARKWAEAGVAESAGKSLDQLFAFLGEFIPHLLNAQSQPSISMRLMDLMHQVGYRRHIDKHAKDALQAGQRWRLVEILGDILEKFVAREGLTVETIRDFVDAMDLRDEVTDDEGEKNVIQLLTLHACKGLEFPVVYLAGVEEDIIPHRTLGTNVSEERRLFYVGVTRAQQRLILTRCRARKRYGKMVASAPSRFLLELDAGLFKEHALGFRPVSETDRKSLLQDLFKKIEDARPQNSIVAKC